MKKFLLLVLVAMIAACAIWYGLRVAEKSLPIAVTSLLPTETLLLAHLPDFNRTRDQWHQTDVYQISREPTVRDFLHKPLARIPKSQTASQNLAEFERLEPKDVFFAVTAWANTEVKMAGGFRFNGSAQDAEKTIGKWRANLLAKFPGAKRETIEYQQHQIETVAARDQTLATVFDGNWFFATNDLAELKAIVDRADGRIKDRNATLAGDATFVAALKHMPSNYATLIYGRLDRYIDKMMPLLSAGGIATSDRTPVYRQIRGFCGTFAFEGGKIRDVLFIGMPKLVDTGPLSRASLALGTKDTFFYLASFLNLTKRMQWPLATPAAAGFPAMIQKFAGAISARGVSLDEWTAAFGPEFGMVGDWTPTLRWPSFLATVPVKDKSMANQVVAKMTASADSVTWMQQEKDGVGYFSMQSAGLFSLAPTLALSEKMFVAGNDAGAVEAAMKRSANGNSELATSPNFQAVQRTVPAATEAFFYLDPALLYMRLDAALRPMLLMTAAFLPFVNQNVDLNKFPPAEAITKHLTPIVMSQNYQSDGYVTESVGPVTMYQAAIGLALLGAGGMGLYDQKQGAGGGGWGHFPSPAPATGASPAGSPSPSPDETP